MANKPLLTLPMREHVAETKGKYLEAFQNGQIVIPDQSTRDWVIEMFLGIELFTDALDKAFAAILGIMHGVNSWRFDAFVAQYREAVDELPETTG